MRRNRPNLAARSLGRTALAIVLLAMGVMTGPAAGRAAETPAVATADCPPIALTAEERQLIEATLLAADDPPPGVAAMDDPALMAALEWHAATQLGLRVRPSRIDRTWALEPLPRDLVAELAAARRDGRLAGWLATLAPIHAGYQALRAERARYRTIVEAGGWAKMPGWLSLKEGDEGVPVEALRARLQAEGYVLAPSATPTLFDADLAAALRVFQRRHDLDEDGTVGAETRRALDVPATDRLSQLDANLERWRWLPRVLPADRLDLDIAAAEAVRYTAGTPVLTMRVIVGSPRHRTPMFVSYLEAVVLNPPWNVPTSIALNEILPKASRDPGYLARNGYIRTPGGLQQRPGPGNALGFVKFDLPSPFGVYLHDTPARSRFAQRARALSHGCMRLEKPRELAEDLLAPQGWTRADIDRAIDAGATRRIALDRTLPLFVAYYTASVDADGRAVFRPDPYGWDARLLSALAAAERGRPAPRRAACSPPNASSETPRPVP